MNNPSTTKAPLADYLAHLPLAEEERERLGESASFSELHARLAGAEGAAADAGGDPALASVRARLQLGTPELDDAEMFGVDAQGRTFLKISPPIRRTKVIPEPWRTNILVRGWRRLTGRSNPPKPKRALPRARWQRVGSLRRFILLLLMLAQTSVATYYMKGILPYQGWAFVDEPAGYRPAGAALCHPVRHPGALRDPLLLGLGRLLDRADGLLGAAHRA